MEYDICYKTDPVKPEEKVYLKLVKSPLASDVITLIACEKDGTSIENGNLLQFEKGRLTLRSRVNKSLGFDLAEFGVLRIYEL